MSEPEVALVFTAEPWVEALHRHLGDHGGARVRQVVVEPGVALEESYDVLVVGNRWPALTRGFVADVHASGRAVLGVHDRDEPAARKHLMSVGVDRVIESDAPAHEFVRALTALRAARGASTNRTVATPARSRRGRLTVVGGPSGSGRTEIAIGVATATGAVLVDADDVAPSIAQRLAMPIEPNLRTAIDAAEHGLADVAAAITTEPRSRLRVVTGLPNARAWEQVRPGEVIRVLDRIAADAVADIGAPLDEVAGSSRGRFALGRALVLEADALVGVCAPTPIGVARFLSWATDVYALCSDAPMVVVVNRAPPERFRRGELFEELTRSLPPLDVVFVPDDARVRDAAWNGTPVARGPFTRSVARVAAIAAPLRRAASAEVDVDALEAAS